MDGPFTPSSAPGLPALVAVYRPGYLPETQRRPAAVQRMLRSMSGEQREELMQLSAQTFGSPELMEQPGQLESSGSC